MHFALWKRELPPAANVGDRSPHRKRQRRKSVDIVVGVEGETSGSFSREEVARRGMDVSNSYRAGGIYTERGMGSVPIVGKGAAMKTAPMFKNRR